MDKILMISLLALGFAGTAGATSLAAPETLETLGVSPCSCESEASAVSVIPVVIPVSALGEAVPLSRGLAAAGGVLGVIPVDEAITGIHADDVANAFKSRSRSGGGCGGATSVEAYEEVVAALEAGRQYHKLMRMLHSIRDGVEAGVVRIKALYNIMDLRPSAL